MKGNSNPKHHRVLLPPSERSGSGQLTEITNPSYQTRLIIKENRTHLVTNLVYKYRRESRARKSVQGRMDTEHETIHKD